MRVTVGLPVTTTTTADDIATWTSSVADHGFDAVFVTDHPAPSRKWLNAGGHPTLDPFVALSFAAAANRAVRVHFNLLVLPYRHALITAKAVATLDQLSGGRVIVGAGVGYLRGEFAALGADYDGRAAVTDATLAMLRAAWTGEPVGASGAVIEPVPQRQPTIWIGGNSPAARRRVAQFGDGWSPVPAGVSSEAVLGTPSIAAGELAAQIAQLRQRAADTGRTTPVDIVLTPTTLLAGTPWHGEQIRAEIGALRAAGATWLVVNAPDAGFDEWLGRLASEVLAQI